MANGEPKTYADGYAAGMAAVAHGMRDGSVINPLEDRVKELEERLSELEKRFPIEVSEERYIWNGERFIPESGDPYEINYVNPYGNRKS